MKPINDLLATHGVPVYDPDDATLSSGEHAQAIIVAALNEQWDRLDGGQQRSIVRAWPTESRHVGGQALSAFVAPKTVLSCRENG